MPLPSSTVQLAAGAGLVRSVDAPRGVLLNHLERHDEALDAYDRGASR